MKFIRELLKEGPRDYFPGRGYDDPKDDKGMRDVVEFVFREAEEEAFEGASQTASAVQGDRIHEHAQDILDEILRLVDREIDKEYGQERRG